MENKCINCEGHLTWQQGDYVCLSCGKIMTKQAHCDSCDSLLNKLQACGSTSYFCSICNELKSSSTVNIFFVEKTDD